MQAYPPAQPNNPSTGPIGPDDPVIFVDWAWVTAKDKIKDHPQFLKLPLNLRNKILANRHVTVELARFFDAGGTIEVVPNLAAPGEYATSPDGTKVIRLRQSLVNGSETDTDTLRSIYSTFIHEIGHYLAASTFDGSSAEAYAESRLQDEMLAALFQLLNWHATNGGNDVSGGNHNYEYQRLYNEFLDHHDLDRLINAMKAEFRLRRPEVMEQWREIWRQWKAQNPGS